jgi:hypothetical protein
MLPTSLDRPLPAAYTQKHLLTNLLCLHFTHPTSPLQITLRCSLSRRQAQLYAALRKNLTLQDLLAMGARAAAAGRGGKPLVSAAASSRLMGLIMQMRKVRRRQQQQQH